MADTLASPSIEEELAACLLPYEAALVRSSIWKREATASLTGSPTGAVEADRQLAEALELVALLAHLDWRLWKRVMDKVGNPTAYRCKLGNERPEKVVVCFGRVSTWSEDFCEFLVNSSNNAVSSPEFVVAKTFVLRVLAEQGRAVDEICVQIGGEYRNSDVHLMKTSQLVSRQHLVCEEAKRAANGSGTSTKHFYRGLRFRSFDMGDIDKQPEAALLGYAAEIASCGISLTYLTPSWIHVQEQHPHEFMEAMTKLFPTSEPHETDTVGGVNCVTIREFSSSRAYPAFFSAIAASSSVRNVNVSPHFDELVSAKQRRWFWSWFAYGVFLKPRGGGADTAINNVSIHTLGLDQEAVDAMAHVLHSPNPMASLFDDEGTTTAPDFVSASQLVLLDPSSSDESSIRKWICGQPFENLPVIEGADKWVSVLLPRWGKAWVHHDDVLPSQSMTPVRVEINSVPHVTLEVADGTLLDPVIAFLHLIGRGIRHLIVTSQYYQSRSLRLDWTSLAGEVLKACPSLESLSFEGNQIKLKTLHRVVDAYSSGSCRLQRLQLDCRNLTGGCRSLPPLIEALSNRRSPASQYLKEIHLTCMPFSTMLKPSAVPACVAMLKENTTLQKLRFSFRVQPQHREQFRDFVNQLSPFDNERIDGVRDPRAKLAFLSVVAADRPEDECTQAIQQLDAHVLSAIFAFAASSFIRRVIVC